MTWRRGWLTAVVVVAYFASTTVWLPSWLIKALGGSPNGVAGLAAVVVWAGFLVAGMFLLRRAQRRGMI